MVSVVIVRRVIANLRRRRQLKPVAVSMKMKLSTTLAARTHCCAHGATARPPAAARLPACVHEAAPPLLDLARLK